MSLTSSAQDVDESLSAYCLATSSSAEDAIRYFHEVRIRAISRQVQHVGALRQNLLNALNLYIHTLRQTADVLSGRLFNSLKKLTMQPVLADPTIRQIGELGIDVYQAWISKEIIFFTPWIKHGQTSKSSADKIITSWSKLAFESLVTEATTALLGCEEFQDALAIRQGLLEAWLPVLNSVPCFSSIDVLEGIRNLMNDRLISILQRQTEKLTHVGVELSSIVTSWSKLSFKTSLSLWDPELVFLDPSDGAVTFKRQLTRRALGQEDHVLQFLNIYENWLTDTMNHFALIRELQNVRWEDILEDDVDEELLESVTGLLKDDDFQLLHISLKKCLRSEYQSLQLKLNEIVEEMDGQHQGLQAAFLLRIIRAIRGSMPDQVVREGYVFAEDIASTMHGILGDEIVRQISLSTLTKSLRRRRQRCAGRTLWEGDPQLPVQPSQAAFKLLQRVTLLMDQQGPDLWNSAAVNDLKSRLISQILSTTKKCLDKGPMKATPVEKSSTNGDIGGEEAGAAQKESEFEIARDHRFQLLFDILFLGFALGQDEAVSDEPLKSFTDAVKEGSELNDDSIEVVKIRSQEYWKRTKLLFGLLS